MIKYIPNIISCSRIIFSIGLFFINKNSFSFFILYIITGLSDVLDGYVARKYMLQSKSGAWLDSFADFIFTTLIFQKIILWLNHYFEVQLYSCLLIIILLRVINYSITKLKFNYFGMIHTYLNKINGVLLFFILPIFFLFDQLVYFYIYLICFISIIASIEELMILINSKDYHVNIKSYYEFKKITK